LQTFFYLNCLKMIEARGFKEYNEYAINIIHIYFTYKGG